MSLYIRYVRSYLNKTVPSAGIGSHSVAGRVVYGCRLFDYYPRSIIVQAKSRTPTHRHTSRQTRLLVSDLGLFLFNLNKERMKFPTIRDGAEQVLSGELG